jgi:alpha-tubulin suppressor-like RCC1 family protein
VLWCWGRGTEGQLGNGATAQHNSPVQAGSATWRTISAGQLFTCGTQTYQTVWCWGDNSDGALGLGDNTNRSTPQQLPALSGRPVIGGSHSLRVTLIH